MKVFSLILMSFFFLANPQAQPVSLDPVIISDKTEAGVRSIQATPSEKVCSRLIEIEINVSDRSIRSVRYTGGCSGNTQGVCALLSGMKIDEAVKKLEGIKCGRKGTSCPDQLARILKSLKW